MGNEKDDMYEKARELVITHQSGSTSFLQRRLFIGYFRAKVLIDQLEDDGVVGPFSATKLRDVLIKKDGAADE